MDFSKTLVVLPTYNEHENLERAVAGVRGEGMNVLIVDDNSPDGTGELADQMAAADPAVTVLHRKGKLGLGSAYKEGFLVGLERGCDLFVEMDADGSHRPIYLPVIVSAAARIGGLGLGSRYVPGGLITGWGWHRKFLSWGANLYTRTMLGLNVHDCTSGYRCYTRELLEGIRLESIISDSYAFQIEMLYRTVKLGFPVMEIPIHFEDRVAGTSKVSGGEIWKDLYAVLKIRRLNVG